MSNQVASSQQELKQFIADIKRYGRSYPVVPAEYNKEIDFTVTLDRPVRRDTLNSMAFALEKLTKD